MHRGEKDWSLNQSPTVNDWGHDPQLCRKNEVTKTRVGLFDDSGFGQRSLAIGLSTCEFVFWEALAPFKNWTGHVDASCLLIICRAFCLGCCVEAFLP